MTPLDLPITFLKAQGVQAGLRTFRPKTTDHPTRGMPCIVCTQPIEAGEVTAILPLGPGSDPDTRRRAREGQVYDSVAIEVHIACITGQEDPEPGREA